MDKVQKLQVHAAAVFLTAVSKPHPSSFPGAAGSYASMGYTTRVPPTSWDSLGMWPTTRQSAPVNGNITAAAAIESDQATTAIFETCMWHRTSEDRSKDLFRALHLHCTWQLWPLRI